MSGPGPKQQFRVALVTSREQADRDEDLRRIHVALGDVGVASEVAIWDANVAWFNFDLALVRSTWDYTWRHKDFLRWLDEADRLTRLVNPRYVLRWNSDKHYLLDLEVAGIRVIPTHFLPPGVAHLPELGAGEFVIKPAVAAAARDAARFENTREGRGQAVVHLAALHSTGQVAMLQPYMPNVERDGERALVFLGGEFSHAIRKRALLAPGVGLHDRLKAHRNVARHDASSQEIATARLILDSVPYRTHEILYARVDLVPDEDGASRLMELELVEPNLFLGQDREAARRLASAVLSTLEQSMER